MNKLKEKFSSAVKTTAMSAQQIYKHKSFNLSKTQEDPEWDEPCGEFMKLYNQITSLIEEVQKFEKTVTELCGHLAKLGDIFMSNVNESDPDHTQKIATAFNTIMKDCGGEPLESATQRINEEILALLKQKLEEMKPLLDAIELRKKAKMDYDHYYFKLEQLRGKPNADPNKVIRNQNKFQECQTALTTITDRLIDKFIEYETARPTFLAYEFQTLRSVQKEFFSAIAQGMSKFKVTQPHEGMPTEPIVAPYSGLATNNNNQFNQGGRRPPKARRAYDDEEEEEGEDGAPRPARPTSQSSFRRPNPGAAQNNAFGRGGAKSGGFASRGTKAPVAVDVEEPAPPARKPKGVYAIVMYDFPGEDEDELPLREGQRVRVTRQHESGWWTGEINGKVGMFPATYVKLV